MPAETLEVEIAGKTVQIRKLAKSPGMHASRDPDDVHQVVYSLTIGEPAAGAP